jgi:hypothetical protein
MAIYEIRVEGQLGRRWSAWFDGLSFTYDGNTTLLRGSLRDEAALHGVLLKIRNLALPLLAVSRVAAVQGEDDQAGEHEEGPTQ